MLPDDGSSQINRQAQQSVLISGRYAGIALQPSGAYKENTQAFRVLKMRVDVGSFNYPQTVVFISFAISLSDSHFQLHVRTWGTVDSAKRYVKRRITKV
jgi:hypothetical protein